MAGSCICLEGETHPEKQTNRKKKKKKGKFYLFAFRIQSTPSRADGQAVPCALAADTLKWRNRAPTPRGLPPHALLGPYTARPPCPRCGSPRPAPPRPPVEAGAAGTTAGTQAAAFRQVLSRSAEVFGPRRESRGPWGLAAEAPGAGTKPPALGPRPHRDRHSDTPPHSTRSHPKATP